MSSQWTVDTLKEHVTALLVEKDKQVDAALVAVKEENRKTEIAAEKRFDLLNELRQGVATREQLEALEKVISALSERLTKFESLVAGRSNGLNSGWGYLIGAAGLLFGLYAVVKG